MEAEENAYNDTVDELEKDIERQDNKQMMISVCVYWGSQIENDRGQNTPCDHNEIEIEIRKEREYNIRKEQGKRRRRREVITTTCGEVLTMMKTGKYEVCIGGQKKWQTREEIV